VLRRKARVSFRVVLLCATLVLSLWVAQRVSAVAKDAYENIESFANVADARAEELR